MKKKLLSTLLLLAAFAATAEESCVKITYQTVGTDTYADGTVVLEHEFYALVWTAKETFGGFNADVTLMDPADKLFQLAPNAGYNEFTEGIGLTITTAQIPSSEVAALPAGYLHIIMLDTRNADGSLPAAIKIIEGGKVVGYKTMAINGYTTNVTVAVSAGLSGVKNATQNSPIKIERVSGIPEGAPMTPVVKNLYFEGEGDDRMMVMVVTNTASYLRYTSGDVSPGSSNLPKTEGAVPSNGGKTTTDEITIKVPANSSTNGLFRIIRN